MTKEPVSVDPSISVADAERIMESRHLKRLPVCINGKVVGMVVRSDLKNVKPTDANSVSINSVMTRNVIYSYPEDSLLQVLRKMTVNGIGGIPIVTKVGVLIGIVTMSDIYKAYQRYDSQLPDEREK